MRTRILRFLTITAGLIAMFAMPAFATHIDRANANVNCSSYTLQVVGGGLDVPGATYVLKYSIVLWSYPGPETTVDGSVSVTPDASFNFNITDTKTWASLGLTLNNTYHFSGIVELYQDGVLQDDLLLYADDFNPTSLTCSGSSGPHLTISKNPKNGTFTQGSQVGYTMVVGNDGTAPATSVHLHDQLPGNGGLLWTGYTTNKGVCFLSTTNLLDCDLGTLLPGESATITVTSANPTPPAACQAQPNPHAVATADGGLMVEDSGMLSCTPPPLPCPAGSFTFSYDASGNLNIIFDQFPAPNDNSYGVNAVGWGNGGHTFSNLVGSDHAGFQLKDPGGTVRLSFNIDYLSANTSAPSGYSSLGPFGGDGKVLIGTLAPGDIAWTTSLANNLNNVNIPGLFSASHVQQFGSVNVLVNSPPTDAAHQTYSNSDPLLSGWVFHDTYYVSISAAKLASLGFNPATWMVEPNLDALHNSPAKACPPPTSGQGLSVTKTEVKDKQVKVTILNSGSVDEIVTALQLSWPTANGKLIQVKLDGDVIYDTPDIPPPSATLTLAQLVADQNKRKIQHGSSDVLTLIFEKNADSNLSNYTGMVSTSGFSLTILP